MPALAYSSDTNDLVSRLRRVLSGIDLDCQCRVRLEGALSRFTALEYRRQIRKALADTRERRDQIVARLAFLAEIDELTEQEPDNSVFAEVATLFDEIGAAASEASKAIGAAAALARARR